MNSRYALVNQSLINYYLEIINIFLKIGIYVKKESKIKTWGKTLTNILVTNSAVRLFDEKKNRILPLIFL